MARYRGPQTKIARKYNEALFGPDKALQNKPYAPGQHGKNKKRKQSEYAVQLSAKQKVKYIYGLLERQFRNTFEKASRKKGVTGTVLLQLLEARLDNVVYRLGIAPSRRAALQLVGHRHIMVNGVSVNIPSYTLKPGDKVSVREKSRGLQAITDSLASTAPKRYTWLDWNATEMTGTFLAYPERELIPENIQEQLVVELYSK